MLPRIDSRQGRSVTRRREPRLGKIFHNRRTTDLEPYRPFVVVVCGLIGSGKSILARELGERIGVSAINSDVVRKELTGTSARGVPFNQGIYRPEVTEKTYDEMFDQTDRNHSQGPEPAVRCHFRAKITGKNSLPLQRGIVCPCTSCIVSLPTVLLRPVYVSGRGMKMRYRTDAEKFIWSKKSREEPLGECSAEVSRELYADNSIKELWRWSERFLRGRLSSTVAIRADPASVFL
jgi:AAA domain